MAKRGPKGPHSGSFKKGVSANPGGSPRPCSEVQQVRKLSSLEFSRAISKFLFLTKPQLIEKLKEPELNCMEALVGNMVARSIQEGDVIRAQFLLDRCIGKVKEQIDITHNLDNVPTPQLIQMGYEAIEVLRKAEAAKLLPETINAEVIKDESPAPSTTRLRKRSEFHSE